MDVPEKKLPNQQAKAIGRALFRQIKSIIEQARHNLAIHVNRSLTELHWHIGYTIHTGLLQGRRAEYGKEILATLSQELTGEN